MNDNSAKIYSFLMTVFVVMLVLTNIIGTKIFVLFEQSLPTGLFGFPLAFTAGIITYPITFLVTDITSEIFGITIFFTTQSSNICLPRPSIGE